MNDKKLYEELRSLRRKARQPEMNLKTDAARQLLHWSEDKTPVGAMYQPSDGSVHCSMQGHLHLSHTDLLIRDANQPRTIYLQVELKHSKNSQMVPLAAIPALKRLTALTDALGDQRAAAFSWESGAVLVIFSLLEEGARTQHSLATPITTHKPNFRIQ